MKLNEIDDNSLGVVISFLRPNWLKSLWSTCTFFHRLTNTNFNFTNSYYHKWKQETKQVLKPVVSQLRGTSYIPPKKLNRWIQLWSEMESQSETLDFIIANVLDTDFKTKRLNAINECTHRSYQTQFSRLKQHFQDILSSDSVEIFRIMIKLFSSYTLAVITPPRDYYNHYKVHYMGHDDHYSFDKEIALLYIACQYNCVKIVEYLM